jgi:hypothetical protein
MKTLLLPFTILILFSACSKEESTTEYPKTINVNLNEFEAFNSEFPFEQIDPTLALDNWELTLSDGYTNDGSAVFSEGNKCANSTDSLLCTTQLDSLREESGFRNACAPGYCFYYLKYQLGDSIQSINENNELVNFLGEISTPSEAVLLAFLSDYSYQTNNKTLGAIKEVTNGYELILTKRVNDCPIQVNRFHLKVENTGSITIINEEIYSKSEYCI